MVGGSLETNYAARDLADLDLVTIPATEFAMGSTAAEVDHCFAQWGARLVEPSYEDRFRDWILKEFPQQRVRMEAFSIGRFPVTNAEYAAFLAATGRVAPESIASGEPGDHPAWGVTFEDASVFATWTGEQVGRPCRLPTEAEWECAARGPSGREYPFGDSFDPTLCNTVEAGIGHTTPVDFFVQGASEYGVCDLAGNVEEWTSSFYGPYPGGRFVEDDLSRSLGPRYRVLRGGSFALGGDLARCARRHGPHGDPRFRYRGFRLVFP